MFILKKYYCPNCKEFKSRIQLKKRDDGRCYWYECRWCHKSGIQSTEDILQRMIPKVLSKKDLYQD